MSFGPCPENLRLWGVVLTLPGREAMPLLNVLFFLCRHIDHPLDQNPRRSGCLQECHPCHARKLSP